MLARYNYRITGGNLLKDLAIHRVNAAGEDYGR